MKIHVLALAMIALASFAVFSSVQAAPPVVKPSPSTPVQVMNDNSTAVPVKILGDVPITGIVVSGESTDALHESLVSVGDSYPGNNPVIGPIDISGYKTIRVVLVTGSLSCGPCEPFPAPFVFVQVGGDTAGTFEMDKIAVNQPVGSGKVGTFATRVYDVPGKKLLLAFASDNDTSQYSVGVKVFGRAN